MFVSRRSSISDRQSSVNEAGFDHEPDEYSDSACNDASDDQSGDETA